MIIRLKFVARTALLLLLAALPAPGVAGAEPSPGFINATRVNMRSEPSTSSKVIMRFDGGELVEVLEQAKGGSNEAHPWHRVSAAGGEQGWVYGEFLSTDALPPRFALADSDGERLILACGEGDSFAARVSRRYSACLSGRVYPVAFEEKRDRSPDWNYRELPDRFDEMGGLVFSVEGEPLPLDDSLHVGTDVLLVEAAYMKGVDVIPLSGKKGGKVPAGVKKEFEGRYKRPLKSIARIASAKGRGEAIYAMEFKPADGSALGVVALVAPRGTLCLDFPAQWDRQSTWHVDDGGDFNPEYYTVNTLLRRGDEYIFTLGNPAPESYTSRLVLTREGKLVAPVGYTSTRYVAPD
ncbi:MAG: SH3 domain-containing protein [Synergistota bacterium]|jgi:hypothetical protein|nr:SH3 domain-containing protein [Synergistota bacterium]